MGKKDNKPKARRQRKYTEDVASALNKIWVICDGICAKRLAPIIPEMVRVLEQFVKEV